MNCINLISGVIYLHCYSSVQPCPTDRALPANTTGVSLVPAVELPNLVLTVEPVLPTDPTLIILLLNSLPGQVNQSARYVPTDSQ